MADESVRLGPPPAAEIYLEAELIIDACKRDRRRGGASGLRLPVRARELRAGACRGRHRLHRPAARGDRGDGRQDRIEEAGRRRGVSVVPGFIGEIRDTDRACGARSPASIGYPVMMKASAGGGGRGMRLAYSREGRAREFERRSARAERASATTASSIEKFIESPRHIEIQVLGDQHGTVLYLGERECSIQRRHQKVIEEAPSPFVTPEMREAMGEQAVALAAAVGYYSAGTVEFIAGADRSFYFLEMNTRLQVEHPVTEMSPASTWSSR